MDLQDDAADAAAEHRQAPTEDTENSPVPKPSPADRIDNSTILGGIIAVTGLALFARAFFTQGLGALDINVLNFGFLVVGLLLFMSPTKYLGEFYAAVPGARG